ncbi:MAG: hypothetical protein VW987_04575 [Alphaproteobacteria bacterium]
MLPIAQSIQQQAQVTSGAKPSVTLSYEQRFLRRKKLVSDDGMPFLVELGETVSMNAGDAFLLDDGTAIVLQGMLAGLGARTKHTEAAFTPEGGAYGHGRTHSHDH